MKRNLPLILILFFIIQNLSAQDTVRIVKVSKDPYWYKWYIEAPLTIGGGGLAYLGLQRLNDKKRLDTAFIKTLSPDDVNKFDRGGTRQYHTGAKLGADAALYGSFVLPFFLLADGHIREDGLKVTAIYFETMAIMANVYTWGVGSTKRIRPYVYNEDVPLAKKLSRGTRNSFFAGHPAASAAATFFMAKVYCDYHPDARNKGLIYGAALLPPAAVAFFRYRGGQHFPTDIAVGIPLGAFIGVIVPTLHKRKNERLSITPVNSYYTGLLVNYKF